MYLNCNDQAKAYKKITLVKHEFLFFPKNNILDFLLKCFSDKEKNTQIFILETGPGNVFICLSEDEDKPR